MFLKRHRERQDVPWKDNPKCKAAYQPLSQTQNKTHKRHKARMTSTCAGGNGRHNVRAATAGTRAQTANSRKTAHTQTTILSNNKNKIQL